MFVIRVSEVRHLARAAAVVAGAFLATAAQAGSLTYQPTNPAFGGSPLNGSWLQSGAAAQNEFVRKEQRLNQQRAEREARDSFQELTPGQIFARQLQSQLYGSLANQITSAIFGENAQPSGTFSFEGTTINFRRVGSNVQISINDGKSVTEVVVPASP
jgi:curli production assembly/transport component CsgF